ncbi:MAG: hypothetical protein M3421_15180 [Bacteroidota bacterium]|nr:hypothetical protein [Bacteroidota bacterium]
MMLKNRFVLYVALCAAGLSACKKDEEKVQNTELPAAEAKSESQKMDAELSKDILEMMKADGMNAIFSLSDLMVSDDIFNQRRKIPGVYHKERMISKGKEFRKIFIPLKSVSFARVAEDGAFNFEANLGVYNWNANTQVFDKSNEVSQSVVINFPLENATTNNVSLILSHYSEISITETNEYYTETNYLPTKITAEIKVHNEKKAGLNFEATYSTKGKPVSASIDLFVSPFNYLLTFSNTGSKSSKLNSSIKKASELLFDASYNLNFTDTDKNHLSELNGYAAYKAYKIQGSVNVLELNKVAEDGDVNPHINLSLYRNASKMGDIIYVNEKVTLYGYTYTERVAYIKYADASKEKLETIFASTFEEMEKYLTELEGV